MKPLRGESGHVLVETILVALVFFVPLFWLMGVLSVMHRSALASASAARDAGSEISRSTDMASGSAAMDAAIHQALVDHGIDPREAQVSVAAPAGLARGAKVTIQVAVPVSVAQAPLLGEASWGPEVWIRSSFVAIVDPFASRP
jgi:hypothetical protein